METTIAVPNTLDFGAAKSKGRAIGALICGLFGAVWMFEALFFGALATPAWLTAIAALAIALIVWPATQLISLRHATYSTAYGQRWTAVSPAYWTIAAIEWVACGVAANWLSRIGRGGLTPQFIGVIVGLHFLPLAKIFKAPIYYWTGAAMVLGSLASLAIPAGHVRNMAAFGVNGISLWATAAVILCQDKLSSR
ncbi:MAG: hypothetical protein WBE37_04365 [Bryobacteraceae bacterium]